MAAANESLFETTNKKPNNSDCMYILYIVWCEGKLKIQDGGTRKV